MEQDEGGGRGHREDDFPRAKRGRLEDDIEGEAEEEALEEDSQGELATAEAEEGRGSLFAELAAAAARAKEHAPALESHLLWYQRRAAGLATDLSGDGMVSYNFRTRQGNLFQIDPDSLPAPRPKPAAPGRVNRREEKDEEEEAEEEGKEEEEMAEGEEEVCLYDPEDQSHGEEAVPVGYHRASKLVDGREIVFLREGRPDGEGGEEGTATAPTEKGKERVPIRLQTSTTPQASSEEPGGPSMAGEESASAGRTAQPLKKRWRDA